MYRQILIVDRIICYKDTMKSFKIIDNVTQKYLWLKLADMLYNKHVFWYIYK